MMMATALEERLTPGKNFRPYDLDPEELEENAKSPPSHFSSRQSPYDGPAAGVDEATPCKVSDLHQDSNSSHLQRDEEEDNTDNNDETENIDDKTSRLSYDLNVNEIEDNDCLPEREGQCLARLDNGYETSPTDMRQIVKQQQSRAPHSPEPSLNYLKDMLKHKDRHLREQLFSNNNDLKHPYNPMCDTSPNDINNKNVLATCLGRRSLQSLFDMTSRDLSKDDNLSGHDSDLDSLGDPISHDYDEDDEDDDFESRESKLDSNKTINAFDLSQIERVATNAEAKRARVEEIITSMRPVPSDFGYDSSNTSLDRRQKRKQYQPQQHEARQDEDPASPKRRRVEERGVLKEQLQHLQSQYQAMQMRYAQLYSHEIDPSLDNKDTNKHATPDRPSKVSDWCPLTSPPLPPVFRECIRMNSSTDVIKHDNSFDQLSHSNSNNNNISSNNSNNSNVIATSSAQSSKHSKKHHSSLKSVVLSDDAIRDLGDSLKTEIASAVEEAVQRVLKKCTRKAPTPKVHKHETIKIPTTHVTPPMAAKLMPFPRPELRPELPMPFGDLTHSPLRHCDGPLTNHGISKLLESSPLRNCLDMQRNHLPTLPPFPHLPYFIPGPPPPPMFPIPEPEQTEALALVVSSPTPTKKKRTKVTDTRLSHRATRALLQDSIPASLNVTGPSMIHGDFDRQVPCSFPMSLIPTSVAITNPSLYGADLNLVRYFENRSPYMDRHSPSGGNHSPLTADQGSPGASHVSSSEGARLSNGKGSVGCDIYDAMAKADAMNFDFHHSHATSTLTPMHLRKAKLMFFYVRYPSSAILKMYFPDIKFNKNNTAQLVKWFSNFREFFYIQMEKYARNSIAEGIGNTDDIIVTLDSEIYRVLNLHYNRNNQLEIPDRFRYVVQETQREFFRALFAGKDTEQSWKKAIYKVIARMDDPLPDYFKSANWLDQLSDI